jgi:signal peptidase I
LASKGDKKVITLGVTLVTLLAIMVASVTVLNFLGYAYPVKGNSMLPTLKEGDVVFVIPSATSDVQIGQIIVYQRGDIYVVHRVVDKFNRGGEVLLKTQGDNNPVPDSILVTNSMLRGIVVLHLPALGVLTFPPYNYIIALVLALSVIYETFLEKRRRSG